MAIGAFLNSGMLNIGIGRKSVLKKDAESLLTIRSSRDFDFNSKKSIENTDSNDSKNTVVQLSVDFN